MRIFCKAIVTIETVHMPTDGTSQKRDWPYRGPSNTKSTPFTPLVKLGGKDAIIFFSNYLFFGDSCLLDTHQLLHIHHISSFTQDAGTSSASTGPQLLHASSVQSFLSPWSSLFYSVIKLILVSFECLSPNGFLVQCFPQPRG